VKRDDIATEIAGLVGTLAGELTKLVWAYVDEHVTAAQAAAVEHMRGAFAAQDAPAEPERDGSPPPGAAQAAQGKAGRTEAECDKAAEVRCAA
jgi:hypothetical protein